MVEVRISSGGGCGGVVCAVVARSSSGSACGNRANCKGEAQQVQQVQRSTNHHRMRQEGEAQDTGVFLSHPNGSRVGVPRRILNSVTFLNDRV